MSSASELVSASRELTASIAGTFMGSTLPGAAASLLSGSLASNSRLCMFLLMLMGRLARSLLASPNDPTGSGSSRRTRSIWGVGRREGGNPARGPGASLWHKKEGTGPVRTQWETKRQAGLTPTLQPHTENLEHHDQRFGFQPGSPQASN